MQKTLGDSTPGKERTKEEAEEQSEGKGGGVVLLPVYMRRMRSFVSSLLFSHLSCLSYRRSLQAQKQRLIPPEDYV